MLGRLLMAAGFLISGVAAAAAQPSAAGPMHGATAASGVPHHIWANSSKPGSPLLTGPGSGVSGQSKPSKPRGKKD